MVEPVVLVHGGACAIPEKLQFGRLEAVKAAARQGYKVRVKSYCIPLSEKLF